jgi:ATP-dependent DNA helicase RecQ
LTAIRELQSHRRVFGRITLRDLLKGRNTQALINKNLIDSSGFGKLSYLSSERILQILDWLTQIQWLRKTDGEYPVLMLGDVPEAYWEGDKEPIKARLPLEKESNEILSKDERKKDQPEQELFDILRRLRREIADEQKVPAFVVFSDAVLREIAEVKPVTFSQFRSIKGVGQQMAVKYSGRFIVCIRDYTARH